MAGPTDDGGALGRLRIRRHRPPFGSDWTTVDVYAPATGMVRVNSEGSDYKVSVRPRDMPWLWVVIFHVNPDPHIVSGAWVEAGDHVGKHARPNSMSDIAMSLGPVEEGRLLSYFETMTDDVFAEYQARRHLARVGDHRQGGARCRSRAL